MIRFMHVGGSGYDTYIVGGCGLGTAAGRAGQLGVVYCHMTSLACTAIG